MVRSANLVDTDAKQVYIVMTITVCNTLEHLKSFIVIGSLIENPVMDEDLF